MIKINLPEDKGPEKEANKALFGSLNQVDRVIAVMSGKGGVGKSTVAALIASYIAKEGYSVGVLDADITGPSQARAFGLNPEKIESSQFGLEPVRTSSGIKVMSVNFLLPNEDDPVVWRGPILASAVNQFWSEVDWRDLDYMVVDLPPGTGDVPLTVLQNLPVDGLVVVSSPQDLAVMVVKKAVKMAVKMNVPVLGLIENMSEVICSSCGERLEIFGPGQGEKLAADLGIKFLGNLPWDRKLSQCMDQGDVEAYFSKSVNEIMKKLLAELRI